jgi:ferredoxin-NADP reductase
LTTPLYVARLEKKALLSEPAQCYHLEFSIPELERFDFEPGQFVSLIATDPKNKDQMRAYSVASAPDGNRFDLCLNRVDGGFFSNKLCDLEPGGEIQFHGPYGMFTLRTPLTDSILIATGTGIAPIRGFVQYLFPETGEDRSGGRDIRLVYGTRHETELYYQDYFEAVAARCENFHYLATLSRPREDWTGLRGYVQEHVTALLKELPAQEVSAPEAGFSIYAYICGLNNMVSSNRKQLLDMGWQRRQIVYERYD